MELAELTSAPRHAPGAPSPSSSIVGRCVTRSPRASKLWSPDEISQRLRVAFPDDPMMQVSHETIYQSLFVQGRGQLRRELTKAPSVGSDPPQGTGPVQEDRGQLPDMVNISERPAEADDRAVPGHWEGDLIVGKSNRTAVGTLVERALASAPLLHLPDGTVLPRSQQRCKRRSGHCLESFSDRSPGTRARRWRRTRASRSRPESRSTSATRTLPGSEARTRTPTVCFVNTCRGALTCRCTRQPIFGASSEASTDDHARPSVI